MLRKHLMEKLENLLLEDLDEENICELMDTRIRLS